MADKDRRHFRRVEIDREAVLRGSDDDFAVRVEDISLNGVLLALGPARQLTQTAGYRLNIPLSEEAAISMDLELMHQEDGHAGFRCAGIDVDSIAHLRRLVELNLGDPLLLDRDLKELAGGKG
ncbi:MAG: PilZ domain-containing protein [Ectothiorhodospiraceae bacterium]|jgi:hypothetical protein